MQQVMGDSLGEIPVRIRCERDDGEIRHSLFGRQCGDEALTQSHPAFQALIGFDA